MAIRTKAPTKGATAATPGQPAGTTGGPVASLTDPWLKYARTEPVPVMVGSLPAGGAGGTAASFVTWNPGDVPEVPAWATQLDFIVTLPIALTVPALATVAGRALLSPYAPFSAFSMQMLLAGSPEWPQNMSLVPWWLDELINGIGFEPFAKGTADASFGTNVPQWYDQGPTPDNLNANFPGTIITNATGAPVVVNFTWQFTSRVRLQRRRARLWGAIPLGDPQNRPQVRLQLNALVGNQPENNPIQDVPAATFSGAPVTAVVGGGGVAVDLVFRAKSTDILPASIQTLPAAKVGLGLDVTYNNSQTIQNSGAIVYQYQRTAQVYESILHAFVNNEQAIDPDYFALWLNQNRQSARWEYDNQLGTMQDYYEDLRRRYGRYLPKGIMVADLEGGDFPTIPRETPYNGLMSPDSGYAASVGVAATPNMSTAFRIPAGTAMNGCYVAIWTLGLVAVPY